MFDKCECGIEVFIFKTMAVKYCYLLILAIFFILVPLSEGNYCSTSRPRPGDPPLPKLDFKAYVVHMQATFLDEGKEKKTTMATEYFDYDMNIIKMETLDNGATEGIIMDYANNAIIEYEFGKTGHADICFVKNLQEDTGDNKDVFGGLQMVNGKPHVFTSQGVFGITEDRGEVYIGRNYIDGILADHWQSCAYWPEDNDNFTMDYFFTPPGWHNVYLGGGPSRIPLRLEITGTKTTTSGQQTSLHHIYEYLDLKVLSRLTAEMTSIPDGLVCQDNDHLISKPLPEMPEQMMYTEEIIHENTLEVREILYFYDYKIASVRGPDSQLLFDFNTGMMYVIKPQKQNCQLSGMEASFLTRQSNTGLLRMANPQEMLFLDGKTATYRGKEDYNDVRCDAWTVDNDSGTATYDVYAIDSQWDSATLLGNHPLVGITKNDASGSTLHSIFGSAENVLATTDNPFDISLCRTPKQKKRLRVAFETHNGFSTTDLLQKEQTLTWKLTRLLADAAGVTPLQMTWTEQINSLTYSSRLYWMGVLFELESDMSGGEKVENSTSGISITAAWNNLQTNIARGGVSKYFDLGPFSALTLSAVSLEDLDTELQNGQFYRTELSGFSKSDKGLGLSNFNAFKTEITASPEECAQKCVNLPEDCTAFIMETRSLVTFCLLGIEERYLFKDFVKSNNQTTYVRIYLSHFTESPGKVQQPVSNLGQSLVEDTEIGKTTCAGSCFGKKGCKSFSLCPSGPNKVLCFLEDSRTQNAVGGNTNDCTRYLKENIADYSVTKGKLLAGSHLEKSATDDVQLCADACSVTEGCSQFSYCGNSHKCLVDMKSDASAHDSIDCEVYQYNPISSSDEAGSKKQTYMNYNDDDDDGDYSSGDLATLSIIMFAAFFVLTLLLVFILAKKEVWNGLGLSV